MKRNYTIDGKIFVSDVEVSEHSVKRLFVKFFGDLLRDDLKFDLSYNENVEPNFENNTFEKFTFDYYDNHKGEDVYKREVLRDMTPEEKENWSTFYRLKKRL